MSDSKFVTHGFSRRGFLKATGYGSMAVVALGALGPMSKVIAAGEPIKTIRPVI